MDDLTSLAACCSSICLLALILFLDTFRMILLVTVYCVQGGNSALALDNEV